MNRWICATLGAVVIAAGLAGGLYMGPVRDHAAVAGWRAYTAVVTSLGRPTGGNNVALDSVTFKDHGQAWGTKLVLPGAWPKGTSLPIWVKWQPPAVSMSNPTSFRASSVIWPIVGLVTGWILGLTLICLLNQPKRVLRREPGRLHIFPRTGVV